MNLIFKLRTAGSEAVVLYDIPSKSSFAGSPLGSQPRRILSLVFLFCISGTGNCSRDLTAKAFVLDALMIGLLILVWFRSMVSTNISEGNVNVVKEKVLQLSLTEEWFAV